MIPLPIDRQLPAIVETLRSEKSLVLVAEPGAGKTTRVPRALLHAGIAGGNDIVVLEPRRLAARMAASFVAQEIGENVGGRVGYQVRFENRAGPNTQLRFVTEGVLMRQLASSPELTNVGAVVLDEFHERHLDSDLALAWLARLQRNQRPDLRIAVMSATLDAAPVASFLGCSSMHVEGRTFEVAIEYAPDVDDRPIEAQVAAALRKLLREGLDGHVLVFLPGARDIRRAQDACRTLAEREDIEIAVLHGDLPPSEQDKAVRRSSRRKVILSTNVAETSITIDGVVAVIDSGLARISRFSAWSGLPRLETSRISRASAKQRAGRAGRTAPGRCVRLYTKHDHDTRPEHDVPEIARSDLTEPVLMLRSLREDPRTFPFFQAPPTAALESADSLLTRLGAIDERGVCTDLGRALRSIPIHPRLARLAHEAVARDAGPRGAACAALIAERDIRRAQRVDFGGTSSVAVSAGRSDVIDRLEILEDIERARFDRQEMRRHELDEGAVRAVARVRDQVASALGIEGHTMDDLEADEEALEMAILAGFPDRVARRGNKPGHVVFAAGGAAQIADSSVVKEASLLVAIDVEERTRSSVIIRMASAIEPEWLLELFPTHITESTTLTFNSAQQRVEQVRSLRYDALVLDESRTFDVSGADASRVLADAAREAGLTAFCDPNELEHLKLRIAFAAPFVEGLEALTDSQLYTALVAACEGKSSFIEIRASSLLDAIRTHHLGGRRAALERTAPESIEIGSKRRRVRIHYEHDRPPWIESRLQDFFGMREGPRIANGAVPLVLHLLAPNQRAVQVTTDLSGFWARHYPTIRKELMRRYPKHAWPEDPFSI